MKYYYPEHMAGYARIRAEGKSAWAEIHGQEGFDNFCSRGFLETVLQSLRFGTEAPEVLVYGCGTGPEACFLAERGFRVDGIDLIPEAIAMAREIAASRGLEIHYEAQDICELPARGKRYDMIVDGYCLQCIVLDEDRQKVFAAVHARLRPHGYYLISTAVMDAEHERLLQEDQVVHDAATGRVYTRYGDGVIEATSGIVYTSLEGRPCDLPDAVRIDGRWYLPNRRHLRPAALAAELGGAGFTVVLRYAAHEGSLVCKVRAGGTPGSSQLLL